MSLTHIATKSIPISSSLFILIAIFNFVPTPSVPDTKTGFLCLNFEISYIAPKPPILPITFLSHVFLAIGLILSINLSAFSIETPDFLYVTLCFLSIFLFAINCLGIC